MTQHDPTSRFVVLVAGVGGQGVLRAARFLGTAGHISGLPVTVSELHGMSQRGGAVRSTVAFGSERVVAPGEDAADVLVALELLEALRAIGSVGAATTVLCSRWWQPPPEARTALPAPDAIEAELRRRAAAVHVLDAAALAERAGDRRAANVVLLGALARLHCCPVPAGLLLATIGDLVPPSARPASLRAFALGQEALAAAGRDGDLNPSSSPTTTGRRS